MSNLESILKISQKSYLSKNEIEQLIRYYDEKIESSYLSKSYDLLLEEMNSKYQILFFQSAYIRVDFLPHRYFQKKYFGEIIYITKKLILEKKLDQIKILKEDLLIQILDHFIREIGAIDELSLTTKPNRTELLSFCYYLIFDVNLDINHDMRPFYSAILIQSDEIFRMLLKNVKNYKWTIKMCEKYYTKWNEKLEYIKKFDR